MPNDESRPQPGSGPDKNHDANKDTAEFDPIKEMHSNPLLCAAVGYGEQGWRVFPCRPKGKEPIHGIRWEIEATTAAEKIRAWWQEYPDANVGIVLGSESDLVVVDIDDPPKFQATNLALVPTLTTRTARGGHFYYRYDARIRNCPRPDRGFEVKSQGTYVLGPPSVHPSGTIYSWVDDEVEIAPAPAWLTETSRSAAAPRASAQESISEGQRNVTLTSMAGGLRRVGLDKEEIGVALGAVNERRCRPPLETDEVTQIAMSVARYRSGEKSNQSGPFFAGRSLFRNFATQTLMPVMRPDAYLGLAREVVETILPHTEADPAILLLTFLAVFGSAAGDNWYSVADAARHPARLNVVVVGATSGGRKGSAQGNILRLFEEADPGFTENHIAHGLASGEGLIAAVRDRGSSNREETAGEEHDDVEVEDKRLLVQEPEFARVLKVGSREGNTLSAVIREAWETGSLRVMTRSRPLKATGAHITIVGHITREELRRNLGVTEQANGFSNRFLFACSRRSKKLPEGGNLAPETVTRLGAEVGLALSRVKDSNRLYRSEAAKDLWASIYTGIGEPDGLIGAVTARAAPQMLRLQVVYAMLAGEQVITPDHVRAAKAVWDYCEASAKIIFGDRNDPELADFVAAINEAGTEGLTATAMRPPASRKPTTLRLDPALLAILKVAAGSRGLSVNTFIANAIAKRLTDDNDKGIDKAIADKHDKEVARLAAMANKETAQRYDI